MVLGDDSRKQMTLGWCSCTSGHVKGLSRWVCLAGSQTIKPAERHENSYSVRARRALCTKSDTAHELRDCHKMQLCAPSHLRWIKQLKYIYRILRQRAVSYFLFFYNRARVHINSCRFIYAQRQISVHDPLFSPKHYWSKNFFFAVSSSVII